MMPLKSILKPPTILAEDSATDLPSSASLNTTPYPTPPSTSPPYLQSLPPALNKIKRKPLPTLDIVIPSQTRFIDSASSANDEPRASDPSANQKQKSNRNWGKKVGFVSPVASYIPDPPPFTSETEEGSDEGYDHEQAETDPNRFDDGHDQDVEAAISAPSTSRSAANPTISLEAILAPEQVPGASKEGKWTSRASERIKAGNKMLVGAGNGIRSLKRGFGGRGRDGG